MEIKKTYWIVGMQCSDDTIEIYSGDHNRNPIFCKLGKGLGKAYLNKKMALKRIDTFKTSPASRAKAKYILYRVETTITEENESEESSRL